MSLKFALIGCGRVARKHVAALELLKETASLTCVCDSKKVIAQKFGTENNVPYYTDPHKMLNKEDVDVISILTPSGSHAELLLHLAGYEKHFVVEKPLALTVEDVDRILTTCNKRGVRVFVMSQVRCNPPIEKLREAVKHDRFGRLSLLSASVRYARTQAYYDNDEWRGTWRLDGGVLANQAYHYLDMLLWMGGAVESVMAKTATRLVDIEVEDTAVVLLKFVNGALGVLEATSVARPRDLGGSISVLGQKGSIVVGGHAMNKLEVHDFLFIQDADTCEARFVLTPAGLGWSHASYLGKVIASIESQLDFETVVEAVDARKLVELLSVIYEAAESRKEVVLGFPRCKLGK